MKITLRLIAISLIVATSISMSFAAQKPMDIEESIYEEAISELFDKQIISGDTDGNFYPEKNLTRAQACTLIVRAIDPQVDLVNGTATQFTDNTKIFSDTKNYTWAANYINYAVQHNIVKGYPNGTFKPASHVTTDEFITMLIGALGYQLEGPWPTAYREKAEELGLFNDMGEEISAATTKGMAAQMLFNCLDDIQAAAPQVKKEPQGTETDIPEVVPYTMDMKFTNGSFNTNMTTFARIPISKDVKIYTYDLSSNYSPTMVMSETNSDYKESNIYKYKNVFTKVWYKTNGSEIISMILPTDVGFTGNAYVVINDKTQSKDTTYFETLSAAKQVTWVANRNLNLNAFHNKSGDGQVYELKLVNGVIDNIATDSNPTGKHFKELTTANTWTKVISYENSVAVLEDGTKLNVRENATIYVWDKKKQEYVVGKLSSMMKDCYLRAYDVSADNKVSADVLVIKY